MHMLKRMTGKPVPCRDSTSTSKSYLHLKMMSEIGNSWIAWTFSRMRISCPYLWSQFQALLVPACTLNLLQTSSFRHCTETREVLRMLLATLIRNILPSLLRYKGGRCIMCEILWPLVLSLKVPRTFKFCLLGRERSKSELWCQINYYRLIEPVRSKNLAISSCQRDADRWYRNYWG